VICTDENGRADFDRLHSRCFEHEAVACAFDLLRLDGADKRRLPLSERKAALRKLLGRTREGIQYVAHAEMCGEEAFAAACELGIEGSSRALQGVDQSPQSEVAGIPAGYRRDVLS
jgi:ATP-dependent DNA ligase